MTTTLLIVASVLLALSGLAIMHLAARLKEAETVQANDRHMIKTMQLHINDMLEVNAVNEQLTAHNRELNAQIAETKHKAYQRQQELLNALKDAETAADDNEWLYNDTLKDLHEACRELEKLQEEHKNTIEGYEYQTELQAREIAELNQVIENLQDDIIRLEAERGGMSRFRIGLDKQILKLKDENKKAHETIRSLMANRIEAIANMTDKNERIKAIAHMKGLNEQIARLELDAYYKAEADLTEAIEAAEEAPIHIDDKKAWICIGEWARLIVYKHNIYQPYIQNGLGAKIERTKRSDLTTKAQERYNALKAALKSL